MQDLKLQDLTAQTEVKVNAVFSEEFQKEPRKHTKKEDQLRRRPEKPFWYFSFLSHDANPELSFAKETASATLNAAAENMKSVHSGARLATLVRSGGRFTLAIVHAFSRGRLLTLRSLYLEV